MKALGLILLVSMTGTTGFAGERKANRGPAAQGGCGEMISTALRMAVDLGESNARLQNLANKENGSPAHELEKRRNQEALGKMRASAEHAKQTCVR